MGMNSQRAKDKAINLMNEEGKEVTVEFLMNHLAVEDGNIPWSNFQDGCITTKLPGGECGEISMW